MPMREAHSQLYDLLNLDFEYGLDAEQGRRRGITRRGVARGAAEEVEFEFGVEARAYYLC